MASAFKKVAGYLGLMDGEELDHGTNQTAQRSPRLVRSKIRTPLIQMLNYYLMLIPIKLWITLFL